jgi:hypothetical protein
VDAPDRGGGAREDDAFVTWKIEINIVEIIAAGNAAGVKNGGLLLIHHESGCAVEDKVDATLGPAASGRVSPSGVLSFSFHFLIANASISR